MIEDIDPLDHLWRIADEAAFKQDMVGVLEAWKKLADNGVWLLCAKVGSIYENGRIGVQKNEQQALYWYRKAIFECDDPEAHVGIGRLYYQGNGVEKNIMKACEHWEKAYAKQYPDAALYLGIAHYNGVGLKQDIQRAKMYLENAAKNEYFFAYGKLARIALDEYKFFIGIKYLIHGFLLGIRIAKINPTDSRLLGIE